MDIISLFSTRFSTRSCLEAKNRQWSSQNTTYGVCPCIILPLIIYQIYLTLPSWNSYNHYACSPNETIVKSNAKALVDLGLDKLGYRYVTIDCGWTIPDRVNGSLTWNETNFPSGFPAVGEYIHDLDLLFGVYEDAGIKSCQTDIEQAGSLCTCIL